MTEQIQILKRLLECVSQKLLSMYLGENRRWEPVNNLTDTVSSSETNISVPETYNTQTKYFLTYELYFIAGCCKIS